MTFVIVSRQDVTFSRRPLITFACSWKAQSGLGRMINDGKPLGEPSRAHPRRFSSKNFRSPERAHIASFRGLGILHQASESGIQ